MLNKNLNEIKTILSSQIYEIQDKKYLKLKDFLMLKGFNITERPVNMKDKIRLIHSMNIPLNNKYFLVDGNNSPYFGVYCIRKDCNIVKPPSNFKGLELNIFYDRHEICNELQKCINILREIEEVIDIGYDKKEEKTLKIFKESYKILDIFKLSTDNDHLGELVLNPKIYDKIINNLNVSFLLSKSEAIGLKGHIQSEIKKDGTLKDVYDKRFKVE